MKGVPLLYDGKTTIPTKACKDEYAKTTAGRKTLNQPCIERGSERSLENQKERLQYLAAGTEGTTAPQKTGYGAITDRTAG